MDDVPAIDLKYYSAATTISDLQKNWTWEQDIPYYDEAETDEYIRECRRLDIYYPQNRKKVPVILYFHGGGFIRGDKKSGVLEIMKLLDCIIVSAEYRLSPKVKCPAYMEDGAAAAAWVLKNIDHYNGDPENVFISGVSAGAYLAMILCTVKRFLNQYGCKPEDFRGYMPLSGQALTHLTIRAEKGIPVTQPVADEYAPLLHVRKDLPPLLMITGQTGLELDCRPAENKLMHDLLVYCGNTTSEFYEIPSLNHANVYDSALPFMRTFILKYLKKDQLSYQ